MNSLARDLAEAPALTCGRCHNVLAFDAAFCGRCGEPVNRFCGECGYLLRPGARFCTRCGTPRLQPAPPHQGRPHLVALPPAPQPAARPSHRRFWLLPGAGFALLAALSYATLSTHSVGLEDVLMVLGCVLGPVTLVSFLWTRVGSSRPGLDAMAVAAGLGIVVSMPLAFVLEMLLPTPTGVAGGSMLIGVIEESAKTLAAIGLLWLPYRRYSSHSDGLILGASVATGFAMVEDALYYAGAAAQGMDSAVLTVWLRTLEGPVTHVLWTALLVGAIWQARQGRSLRLTPTVVGTFALVVVLHGLWDWLPLPGLGILVVWLTVAAAGVLALRRQIQAARRAERTAVAGGSAPPVLLPEVARGNAAHAA